MPKIWMTTVGAAALILAAPVAFAQTAGERPAAQEQTHHSASEHQKPMAKPMGGLRAMERQGEHSKMAQGAETPKKAEEAPGNAKREAAPDMKKKESMQGAPSQAKKTAAESAHEHMKAKPENKAEEANGHKKSAEARSKSEEKAGPKSAEVHRGGTTAEHHATPEHGATAEHGANGRSVAEADQKRQPKLDPAKRDRIRRAIHEAHVTNVTHVDFNINVGTVVPDHYHFYPVPPEIVSIVPEYRGYDYMLVNDEIIIVSPQTHRIVYTLPENQSASLDVRSTGCR